MLSWEQELEKQGFRKRGVNSWYAYFQLKRELFGSDKVMMEVFNIRNKYEFNCLGNIINLNTPADIKTACNIVLENI